MEAGTGSRRIPFLINDALEKGSYGAVYAAVREEEKNSKDMLVQFGEKYPNVTTQSNVNEILASLKAKSDKYQKPSIIGQLREFKEQQGMSPGDAPGHQLKKSKRDAER
ncbi:MAG: hypothetical protein NC305_19275 [Lachnospiraceae bacterium]|nr:hypothetical protein [Lachnospiraceae bacterium]